MRNFSIVIGVLLAVADVYELIRSSWFFRRRQRGAIAYIELSAIGCQIKLRVETLFEAEF